MIISYTCQLTKKKKLTGVTDDVHVGASLRFFFSVCLHRQECVNVFWNVPYFILVFNVKIFIDSCHICMQVCANWTFLQVHTTLYANDSLTFSAGNVCLGLISWSASLIDGIYYLDLCCIKGFHPKKRCFFSQLFVIHCLQDKEAVRS